MDLKEGILGVIRHVLTFVGGIFATKGTLEASEVEAVAGAVVTIVGVVWSLFTKKKADKVEA